MWHHCLLRTQDLESNCTFHCDEYECFPRIWLTNEIDLQASSSNKSKHFSVIRSVRTKIFVDVRTSLAIIGVVRCSHIISNHWNCQMFLKLHNLCQSLCYPLCTTLCTTKLIFLKLVYSVLWLRPWRTSPLKPNYTLILTCAILWYSSDLPLATNDTFPNGHVTSLYTTDSHHSDIVVHGGHVVKLWTIGQGDRTSKSPAAVSRLGNLVHCTLPVSFRRDTNRCWSLLPGVYAWGNTRSHTRGKTYCGLHLSCANAEVWMMQLCQFY